MNIFTTRYVKPLENGRFELHKDYYASCSRTEKIKSAWLKAVESRGKSLFNKDWWYLIKAALVGYAFLKTEYKSRLKIHTFTPLSLETNNEKGHLQDTIDKNNIALNLNPPLVKNKNQIDSEAKKELIDSLKGIRLKSVVNTLFDSMEFISFENLVKGLNACSLALKEKLNGQDFQVGFAPLKSQKWLAELAIPMMNQAPTGSFTPTIDTIGSTSTQGPLSNERQIVVFDDCSYSGVQLKALLSNVRMEARKKFGLKKVSIHLVVPFISKVALERLESHKNSDFKEENYKIHIYTTNQAIPTVAERLTKNEIDAYESVDIREKNPACEEYIANKCLAYAEWKVPDSKSIPLIFTQIQKKVFGDNQPPYKTDY